MFLQRSAELVTANPNVTTTNMTTSIGPSTTTTNKTSTMTPKQHNTCSKVAFLLVGLVRTFAYEEVRQRILQHFINGLAGSMSFKTFMVAGSEDDPRPGFKTMSNSSCKSHLSSWLQHFNPAAAACYNSHGVLRAYHSDEDWRWARAHNPGLLFERNNHCKVIQNGTNISALTLNRWFGQWSKVRAIYGMMQDYEHMFGCTFEYVARLRPDIVALRHFDPLAKWNLTADEIAVPEGVVYTGPGGLNDHMAICRRVAGNSHACDRYFDMSGEYSRCQGLLDFKIDDGNQLLGMAMQSHAINVRKVSLIYTMLRPCSPNEHSPTSTQCHRVPVVYQSLCENVSKSICSRQF
jgi:hypothetical protein